MLKKDDIRIGKVKEFMKMKKWCDEKGHKIIFEKGSDEVWRPHIQLNIDGLTEDTPI